MDACFEVLVERFAPSSKMERQRHAAHWGGKEHVQRPDSFRWGDHVELKPVADPLPTFLARRLPTDLGWEGWHRLQITGDMLDYMAYEATGGEVDWGEHSPDALVSELLDDHHSWIAVFLWQWDQLDEVVEIDSGALVGMLRDGFSGAPRGFVGVHRARGVSSR